MYFFEEHLQGPEKVGPMAQAQVHGNYRCSNTHAIKPAQAATIAKSTNIIGHSVGFGSVDAKQSHEPDRSYLRTRHCAGRRRPHPSASSSSPHIPQSRSNYKAERVTDKTRTSHMPGELLAPLIAGSGAPWSAPTSP
jgi:hypothetical protein